MKRLKVTHEMAASAMSSSFDKIDVAGKFWGRRYEINNEPGHILSVGDVCWCHPCEWSNTSEKYQVHIFEQGGLPYTRVLGHHSRLLYEYIFCRLEFIENKNHQ